MSATLEPREVEKPFHKRWLRMTWQLFLRSPVRFGVLVGLLAWIDTSAVNLASGAVIPRIWVARGGMLLLPMVWVIVGAVARGADDPRQTWTALRALWRASLWVKALVPGAALTALSIVIFFALESSFGAPMPTQPTGHALQPGALLENVAAQSWLVSWVFGICYAPLAVFFPELSFMQTRKLSESASIINNRPQIHWLVLGVLCVGLPLQLIPAYGIGEGALLVFMGTLNYVAYRDIFERRAENVPARVVAAGAPRTAAATVDIT